MPRCPRNTYEEGTFHITIRGNNKKRVFRKRADYHYFKKLLTKYKEKFQFFLYHYALMINHVHLCVKITKKIDISKIMQGLEISYNHFYKRHYNYVGHLWQGRFDSRPIETDKYLLTVGLYIERNPVRAGVVEDPVEYPWTSYRYYALGEKDPLVDPNPLYYGMGADPEERRKHYIDLMHSQIEEPKTSKLSG